ncbi:MAG: hypothetical protein ACQESF_07090 [Nanobdellota archaeon]
MKIINILAKIISSLLTLFILFINFDMVSHTWKWGFDESNLFILIPFILLLVFFIYFTYKIFTKKDFINEFFHNMKQFLSTLTDTKLKKVILHLIVVSILMSLVSLAAGEATVGSIGVGISWIGAALSLASALFLLIFILFHSFINIKNVYTKIAASVNLILPGILIFLYFILDVFSFFADTYSLFIALFSIIYFFSSSILFINFFTNIKSIYAKISNYINLILGIACAFCTSYFLFMITWGAFFNLLFIYGSAFLWCITPRTKIISNMRRILVNLAFLFPLASSLYYIRMGINGIYLNANKPNPGLELLIPWWAWLILIGAMIAIPILNKFFSPKRTSDRSYEIRY